MCHAHTGRRRVWVSLYLCRIRVGVHIAVAHCGEMPKSPRIAGGCPGTCGGTWWLRGPVIAGGVRAHRQVSHQVFRYRPFWPFGGNGHLDPDLRKKGGLWRWHWAPGRPFVCVIWLPQNGGQGALVEPASSASFRGPCQWLGRIGFCLDRPNAMGLPQRSIFHFNEKRAYPATRDD